MIIVWLLKLGITMLIHNKFPSVLGHLVFDLIDKCLKYQRSTNYVVNI